MGKASEACQRLPASSWLVIVKAAKAYSLLAAAVHNPLGAAGISNSLIHRKARAKTAVGEPIVEHATVYILLSHLLAEMLRNRSVTPSTLRDPALEADGRRPAS